jgi:signal transduction histidine kinase
VGSSSILLSTSVPQSDDVPAILIVDDHQVNLVALEATLEPLGYRIVRAGSGTEALKQLLEHDFVLIVMDVHMPDLDGYQTTALIRERRRSREIPVVFLTAVYNQPEHTRRGYELGAVDYITKPFDPEVLRAKVRALVGLYMRGQRAERERTQEVERLKDLFLGAIGHDLRTPLNAIILASHLMARDDENAVPVHRAYAQRIERAGRRMQRMIDDILDLTRGQFSGGIPLSLRPTNASDVCRAVIDEHRLAHPGRAVQLEAPGDVHGCWDPGRLGRVVANLVGNAIDHSKEAVRVRLLDAGESAIIEVRNGGSPIDPAILPHIFEPFRRGESDTSGLGLGLFIVREIAQAHGGSVEVHSTAGEGTTFTVTLPKAAEPNSAHLG